MKENLMIQFVYPEEELPIPYKEAIDSIDHNTIVSSLCEDRKLVAEADIVVFHEWIGLDNFTFSKEQAYVLRTSKKEFFDRFTQLKNVFSLVNRFNVVLTDIENFSEKDYDQYKKVLTFLSVDIEKLLIEGNPIQFNLLTDRMNLSVMNNCNAGWENITLAPDGNFMFAPLSILMETNQLGMFMTD